MTDKQKNIHERISTVLSHHKVLNLSYIDTKERPQSCALWYSSDEDNCLFYLSSLTTRHGSVLQSGGHVSFTINQDDQEWREIVGIQGRGYVTLLEEGEDAWKNYTSKFPFVLHQFQDLENALQEMKIWKISPSWFRLIDNRIEFGYKEEVNLE